MKKADRKQTYIDILRLMINEDHKEAFNALTGMCGKDTGLFYLANYDEVIKEVRAKKQAK